MHVEASKQQKGDCGRRRRQQLANLATLHPLLALRRRRPASTLRLACCVSSSGPRGLSGDGFGKVRFVNSRINFDFVDGKSLLIFRARAALINSEGELQSLDFAIIGKEALPGKRLVSDLASPFPSGRQECADIDKVGADFPALGGYLQTISRLAVRISFPDQFHLRP